MIKYSKIKKMEGLIKDFIRNKIKLNLIIINKNKSKKDNKRLYKNYKHQKEIIYKLLQKI